MVKTEQEKPLTKCQEAFVEAMANPQIKTEKEAAIVAGYSPNSASEIAYENLRKPQIAAAIQNRINRALTHHQVTPEEVLGLVVFQMRSSMNDLMDEQGFFDLEKARETGAIDLIKEIEFDESIDLATGARKVRHKVKFDSPSAARKEVANYIGLEKFAPPQPLTDEQLARELLRRLLDKGFQESEILAKLEKEFPAIDVKAVNAA